MLLSPKKWIVCRRYFKLCPAIAPSKWKDLKSTITEKKQREKTEKKCKRGIVKGYGAMWRCLTVGFTPRSEKAVEAGARGTGQALCVGALLLPCLLSSLLQSHDAPAALSAIDQSECKRGATTQWGYIKDPKWWEAQGLMLAHNRLSHERETAREWKSERWDVCLKKKNPDRMHPFLQKGIGRTKHLILLPKPVLCQPHI